MTLIHPGLSRPLASLFDTCCLSLVSQSGDPRSDDVLQGPRSIDLPLPRGPQVLTQRIVSKPSLVSKTPTISISHRYLCHYYCLLSPLGPTSLPYSLGSVVPSVLHFCLSRCNHPVSNFLLTSRTPSFLFQGILIVSSFDLVLQNQFPISK